MITSSILFCKRVALGTSLGICCYPIVCFRLILRFLVPVPHVLAESWSMRLLATSKAKGMPTRTMNSLTNRRIGIHSISTPRSRTPSNLGVTINKRFCKEEKIFLVDRVGNELFEKSFINQESTIIRRTRDEPRFALLNLHREVLLPAEPTKEVLAIHAKQLKVVTGLLITDGTTIVNKKEPHLIFFVRGGSFDFDSSQLESLIGVVKVTGQ
mmetsp:Transcript_22671/g.35270  ORF Transcript_22671/g.35270 Transcript_22671/m.35270 type:complete len:212 (-) Transcript_22671:904-1539(-)